MILANKNELLSKPTSTSGLLINLVNNDAVANLYIIPSTANSEKSAVTNHWNYPVKPLEVFNNGFLRVALTKELHVRKSTLGSTCTELLEDSYYKVILGISEIIHNYIQTLSYSLLGSALVKS